MKLSLAFLALLVSPFAAFPQNAALMPLPMTTFLDLNGHPLAGGLIYTCQAGTTCNADSVTLQNAYTSSTAGTPLSNPVVLDSAGRASIWLGPLPYKIAAFSALGVSQWSVDNVSSLDSLTALGGAVTGTLGATKLRDFHMAADYGIKNDGVTDNYAAFHSAIASLISLGGGTLYFPMGTYRCGRQGGLQQYNGCLEIAGGSNIALVFDGGATLLMDNLDGSNNGEGNGIIIRSGSHGIKVLNATVRGAGTPNRSQGNGFEILGDPVYANTVYDVQLINCTSQNTPETGLQMIGNRNTQITNFRSLGTKADGINTNATQGGVSINGYYAENPGDDGIGIVTYYNPTSPTSPYLYGNYGDPLNSPDQTTRNNNGLVISDVTVIGGTASGIRITDAYSVSVTNVNLTSVPLGIVIEGIYANGTTLGWWTPAPLNARVENVVCNSCGQGFVIQALNQAGSGGGAFWTTFNSTLSGMRIYNSTTYAGAVVGPVHGMTLTNIANVGSNGFSLGNLDDSYLDQITSNGSDIQITGSSVAEPVATNLPVSNLRIGQMEAIGAQILIQNMRGVEAERLTATNSAINGLNFTNDAELIVHHAHVYNANRTSATPGRGILISKGIHLDFDNYNLEQDSLGLNSIEITGGTAAEVSDDIQFHDFVYRNQHATGANQADIVVEADAYAATNVYFAGRYYNGGDGSPAWFRYGVIGTASVSCGAGAGTSPPSCFVDSHNENGVLFGSVGITAGTSPATGTIATVTFNERSTEYPMVNTDLRCLAAVNGGSITSFSWGISGSTAIFFTDAFTPLTAAQSYTISYSCH